MSLDRHRVDILSSDLRAVLNFLANQLSEMVFDVQSQSCSPYRADEEQSLGEEREPGFRLPIPARYVIGTNGVILAADVNADYTIRLEPADTVKFLRMLHRD